MTDQAVFFRSEGAQLGEDGQAGPGRKRPGSPRGFAVVLLIIGLVVTAAVFAWRHYRSDAVADPKIEIGIDPPGLPIGEIPTPAPRVAREVEAGAGSGG